MDVCETSGEFALLLCVIVGVAANDGVVGVTGVSDLLLVVNVSDASELLLCTLLLFWLWLDVSAFSSIDSFKHIFGLDGGVCKLFIVLLLARWRFGGSAGGKYSGFSNNNFGNAIDGGDMDPDDSNIIWRRNGDRLKKGENRKKIITEWISGN